MAPRLPIPRITLKRRPSSRNDSPGLSSVPASIDPIITLSAPAASAFTTSPEYLMPPSAITGTSPAPSPPPPPPPPPPRQVGGAGLQAVGGRRAAGRSAPAHPPRRPLAPPPPPPHPHPPDPQC